MRRGNKTSRGEPLRVISPVKAWGACLAIAMLLAACGGSSDDAATTTSPPAGETTTASETTTADVTERSGVYFVRVQFQVDEATADETLAVLADNGFDEFTKEESAGDGFDVLARSLTEDQAAALVVRLTTDTDVPYNGVIFEES